MHSSFMSQFQLVPGTTDFFLSFKGDEISSVGSFWTMIEMKKKIVPDTVMVVKGETDFRLLLAGKTALELGILAIPRRITVLILVQIPLVSFVARTLTCE